MSSLAKDTRTTVIPSIRYRDEPAAIQWLCQVFGFEQQLIVPNEDGSMAPCSTQLWQWDDHAWNHRRRTHNMYVVVSDTDEVYARIKSAGAEILREISDEEYGGRGFICRDVEGHVWSFGTYDPW